MQIIIYGDNVSGVGKLSILCTDNYKNIFRHRSLGKINKTELKIGFDALLICLFCPNIGCELCNCKSVYINSMEKAFSSECSGACLKIHSRQPHAPLCVRFVPNSGYIARYAPFIWHKSPTKCDAHLTKSIFKTRSSTTANLKNTFHYYLCFY